LASVREKRVVEDLRETAFRRHYAQVYRFLRRRTGSHEEAEDLAQVVFTEAAARLHEFRPGAAPVLAWLYTVAQRRLVDRARRVRAGSETVAELLEARRLQPVEPLGYGANVAEALREAIGALPEGQRRVVVMKLLEGRPFAEMAQRLGASEAACKMRFARGLESVRDELARRGIEP
jgi:RNA polymerase sigma factor (sigma-70 family)